MTKLFLQTIAAAWLVAVTSTALANVPLKVDAFNLALEYKLNAFAANQKYEGKQLEVAATVVRITKADSGEPLLQLGGFDGGPAVLAAYLPISASRQIASLAINDAVVLKCDSVAVYRDVPVALCSSVRKR